MVLGCMILLAIKLMNVQCDSSSHQTNNRNSIPWSILLDPNYTSHKLKFSTPNLTTTTTHSPSRFIAPSYSNQLTAIREPPINVGGYYVPPSTTQETSHSAVTRYTMSFPPQKNLQMTPGISAMGHQRPNQYNVVFPSNGNIGSHRPDISIGQPFRHYPTTSQKDEQKEKISPKEKEQHRRPPDYFDFDQDDYIDNFYQDYDYIRDNKGTSHTSPDKYRHSSNNDDPLKQLPSSSDPDGFFSKANDLLRGGTLKKNNVSPYPSDVYYSGQSPPSKYFTEPELNGNQLYYGQDQENPNYASKPEYYNSGSFDYDINEGDGEYAESLHYAEKRKGTKYGPLAFVLGLLPLGLLLATLVPTVVTIPVTTAVATGKRRKRSSVQFVNPVLETIARYGASSLDDPVCLNRIFCQVVQEGKQERSSIVQKLYFKISHWIDENLADYVGLKTLFKAIHEDRCEIFDCSTNTTSLELMRN